MVWLAFMEKKRNELANTGHIMDDETLITHLLNSLPQAEYEGAILVIKERLRGSTCDLAQVEQLLEDKYLFGRKKKMTMHCLLALPKRKGRKNSLKDDVATVERLDTRQRIVLTRKAKKEDSKDKSDKGETQKPKKDSKGKGKTDMSKLNVIIVEKWVILLGTA